jgi:hypothetical protein
LRLKKEKIPIKHNFNFVRLGLLADGDWDNRLNVECEPVAVIRPDIKILVCLEGHLDERRDGILELFGELRGLIVAFLCAGGPGRLRGKGPARRHKKSYRKCRTHAHFQGEPRTLSRRAPMRFHWWVVLISVHFCAARYEASIGFKAIPCAVSQCFSSRSKKVNQTAEAIFPATLHGKFIR